MDTQPAGSRPPMLMLTPEKGSAATGSTDDLLCAPADPNLCCPICCNLFERPMRTPCGHIFCDGCITSWMEQKSEGERIPCPECRSVVETTALQPDRLADRLVSNVDTYCQLAKLGCPWVGKRGSLGSHLAHECEYVTVTCAHTMCGAQMFRFQLAEHMRTCKQTVDCPYGCGERLDSGTGSR